MNKITNYLLMVRYYLVVWLAGFLLSFNGYDQGEQRVQSKIGLKNKTTVLIENEKLRSFNFIDINSDLIAYYPFDGNANDISQFEHHGVVNGATLTADRFGSAEKAYLFDGNDFINVPTTDDINNISDAVTISAWVKPDNQYYHTIIAKGSAHLLMDMAIYQRLGMILSGVTFTYTGAQNYWGRLLPYDKISTNEWSHLVMTFSKSEGKITMYLNNQIIHESAASGTMDFGDQDLRIGARISTSYPEYFKGAMDDIGIYSRVLNAAEITALYEGATPKVEVNQISNSIETLVLQPDGAAGKDASIHMRENGLRGEYPDNDFLLNFAWTFGGVPGTYWSLIDWDLSGIPEDATITSAKLDLYAHADYPHSTRSGSNDLWIERITQPWEEATVTWDNKPGTSTNNRVAIPAMTSTSQNQLNIDVLNLMKDHHANPVTSHGMMLKLQTDRYYRSMNFYSSDFTDAAKRPRLTITYEVSETTSPTDTCVELTNSYFIPDTHENDPNIRYSGGKVIIGDSTLSKPGNYRLYVEEGILTEKAVIAIHNTSAWADYVFEPNYPLLPLKEVAAFIQKEGHLPEVPSANEVVEKGINVGEMEATLLKKIEELWLHLIELNEKNKTLKEQQEKLLHHFQDLYNK